MEFAVLGDFISTAENNDGNETDKSRSALMHSVSEISYLCVNKENMLNKTRNLLHLHKRWNCSAHKCPAGSEQLAN